MASFPLPASHIKVARAPAGRRALSGARHDGRGALGLVVDLHLFHILVHFGEHQVEGLVAVDGVRVLWFDRLRPEVPEGLAGREVEGFDGDVTVVPLGGESWGGDGEDREGDCGGFHGCFDRIVRFVRMSMRRVIKRRLLWCETDASFIESIPVMCSFRGLRLLVCGHFHPLILTSMHLIGVLVKVDKSLLPIEYRCVDTRVDPMQAAS